MAGELPPGYAQQFELMINRLRDPQTYNVGGGSSSDAGQNSQSTSQSYSQGGTYFANPDQAARTSNALSNLIGQQAQDYSQFVNDPTSSPAYTNALAGMLAALAPGEAEGRRDLADVFRAAGNTASSSFAEAANKYQQGVDRNRQLLASDLLAKLYPQIAGAKFAPISQTAPLLDATKLEQNRSQSQSQSSSVPGDSGTSFGLPRPRGIFQPPSPMQPLPPFPQLFSSPGAPKYGAGY